MEYYAAERKKENPTFCESMDGTREYYAMCNKAGSERQISCDLTYKRNLMNKTNKKGNRTRGMETRDSDQMGGGRQVGRK